MAGDHDGCRSKQLRLRGQVHARPLRDSGLHQPDVEGAAQIPYQRSVLEDEGNRLDRVNQRPGCQRVNDVVGHDLDVGEPLVRGPLHQLELAHADLTLRIARIPPDRPNRRFLRNTCGFQ